MPFLQLTLLIGREDPAPFEDALFFAGATSVTLEDAADDPILEPAPGATPLWPTVRAKALFEGTADPEQTLARLKELSGSPLPNHEFALIADRAWEREWLKDFRPMQFGRRLWVCPNNERPALAACPLLQAGERELVEASESALTPCPLPQAGEGELAEAVFIDLDPGLAFGTGTHATTALCLEWLDGADLAGKSVIDYGCGSGILAIAALKLGASSAIGIDLDPQALIATRDNAARNLVGSRLTVRTVEESAPAPADIVLANILSKPLLTLAPRLADLVLPGGDLVLSGLLANQADAVASRYAPWFDMAMPVQREDWVRLHGRKRAAR
jgi:ribosomal protein L11 methyltransferase